MIRNIHGNTPLEGRSHRTERLEADLVIVGGGLAGTCGAITAAREGLNVLLIQDRPVLGGNASSEVRLWVLGATSHMANNNRWAREGGVVDEVLVENLYRNPEGNPLVFDTILLEKAAAEPNLTLLLNTAAFDCIKSESDRIEAVRAFCSQNGTMYEARAPLFCDASGDGTLGFLAGAAFRMGAEGRDEFGEGWAPPEPLHELLGHSMYFYTEDTGKPVRFVPPSFALDTDRVREIARYRRFNLRDQGCNMWWVEYGGTMDTIHDTEQIKWTLWSVVYGMWNYYKNSGEFPDAETMTLKWVSTIPGKRESRRFEGDYILSQPDLVEQRRFDDAVSFGGWALDLHPPDGVFSKRPGAEQYHAKGVYQIPYRCLYSRNIRNLFLAGRIISATHVAFGSTRVMATCAHGAQAAAMAAAVCVRYGEQPSDLLAPERMRELQRDLLRSGQYIPHVKLEDDEDLVQEAEIEASSWYVLDVLDPDGPLMRLEHSWAMLLPVGEGPMPKLALKVKADHPSALRFQLRSSSREGNFTPDVTLAERVVEVEACRELIVRADFGVRIDRPQYVMVCILSDENVSIRCSEKRVTGVLALTNLFSDRVATSSTQQPPEGSGLDVFEFWRPLRRPGGHNLACALEPGLDVFGPENVGNGFARPTTRPNAWVASPDDPRPTLRLRWDRPRTISRIDLSFDTDFDHPMESVLMTHPEREIPFCVKRYSITDGAGRVLVEESDNHQTRNVWRLPEPVETDRLHVEVLEMNGPAPAALFEIRCYR